jgi:pyruvate dehydrogenase E1 component alpha subunit
MAEGIGLKSYFCNGNKVDDCYDLIKRVAAEIRAGSGPQFIEFETYRWREHCGPNYDNHIGYRAESEFEEWKKKDPVAYYENKMIQEGTLTKAQLDKIDKEIRKEIQVSFDQAKSAPFPGSEEAFTDLYWSDSSQMSIN